MFFNFKFFGDVYFGKGSLKRINEILYEKKWNDIVLVIDHALLKIDSFLNYIDGIKHNNLMLVECDISEPTYDSLDQKRIIIDKNSVDCFIGIGGGSAIDMAKGLSVLYSNDKKAISYRGFDKFKLPIKPIIAIPTTAGTGSEITPNASFIDTEEKIKMGINGEAIRPSFSILDPELTLSCPLGPTISAGIDSIVHATEAFVAKKSNPMAKIFAKEGFNLVIKNIVDLSSDLDNLVLREKVMYGAFLSAIALMNSGTGPAAAMSYPLGVHFGVPHGIGGGIFLPYVVEHNILNGVNDYAPILKNKSLEKENSVRENSESFLREMKETWDRLNIPRKLGRYGFGKTNIQRFVSDTLDLKGALDQNPVPFYENEILSTIKKLI